MCKNAGAWPVKLDQTLSCLLPILGFHSFGQQQVHGKGAYSSRVAAGKAMMYTFKENESLWTG